MRIRSRPRARLARIEAPARLSRRRSAGFARKALEERVRTRPSCRLATRKAWDWLRPYPDAVVPVEAGRRRGRRPLPDALALGARGLWRAPPPGGRLRLAFLLVSMAVHVALMVVWRYRMP